MMRGLRNPFKNKATLLCGSIKCFDLPATSSQKSRKNDSCSPAKLIKKIFVKRSLSKNLSTANLIIKEGTIDLKLGEHNNRTHFGPWVEITQIRVRFVSYSPPGNKPLPLVCVGIGISLPRPGLIE
jgi:hypothetical protein